MKNKRILILGGSLYPITKANMNCISKLIPHFLEKNLEVHIISLGNPKEDGLVFDNAKCWFVKRDFFGKIVFKYETDTNLKQKRLMMFFALWIHRFFSLLLLPFYPLQSLWLLLSFFFKAKKLYKKYNYDIVLAVHRPYETLWASYFLKKNNNFKLIFYLLDSFGDIDFHKFISKEILAYIGSKWEHFLFKKADLILVLRSHEKHYGLKKFSDYPIAVVDIPYITNDSVRKDLDVNVKKNYWIYAGSLYMSGRYPSYLFKFISYYNINKKGKEIFLDVYGGGKIAEKNQNSYIRFHGFVSKNKINQLLYSSDLIVALGQKSLVAIPSKIFEIINTRKKFIYFYNNDRDVGVPYIKKYPGALLIDEREDMDKNIKKVNNFIEQDINLDDLDLCSIFKENTPEFTVNKILKIMN